MPYRTTQAHFRIFREEVLRLMEAWGLHDWKAYFAHKELEDARGQCGANLVGRCATFFLGTYWDEEPTPERVRNTARHETLELLIAPLECLGRTRFLHDGELRAEAHALIRRLEKILSKRGDGMKIHSWADEETGGEKLIIWLEGQAGGPPHVFSLLTGVMRRLDFGERTPEEFIIRRKKP